MSSSAKKALHRLFDKGAASYAKFRPEYPPELYHTVLQHANLAAHALAVDVATGSGQAAKDLTQHFDKVIALDSNQEQLKHAPQILRVTFQLGSAEQTGISSATADLVTVAQALHWFDLDRFYAEAKRILKPDGSLAIWGYDVPNFTAAPANTLLEKLYSGTLGPYWDAKRKHVDDHLRGLEPSAQHFSHVQRIEVDMHKTMSLPQLVGYLTTWSGYNTFLAQCPEAPDPIKQFAEDFPAAAKLDSPDASFDVRFPIFLLLCSNRS